ncbi:hypothetical protein FJQ54_01975 [Sandaracinobacter neustonicus]|uniref:Uncharacterized protein n=1 Tax=Sandaracinobacter neustonicus TaxID=1715348 RepID=A0A501XSC1_9SPHN|nr:hypothetical protein [Sandaracinobacter neustonicus]TPE63652.1 hypothetical protein FJQ54_01975 [Sandaracinobacter neustonicus]
MSMRNEEEILVILHGGLGNQMFQQFMGELLGNQMNAQVFLVSGVLHRYSASHVFELDPLLGGKLHHRNGALAGVARLRIPKFLAKAGFGERALHLGRTTILDGYFQSTTSYQAFPERDRVALLEEWAERLNLSVDPVLDGAVEHIRLRDFFKTREAAEAHARMRVQMAGPGRFMTDDDSLLIPLLAEARRADDLVQTDGWSAWDALRYMSRFSSVRTNGSTLALWAALLRRRELHSSLAEQMAFFRAMAPSR